MHGLPRDEIEQRTAALGEQSAEPPGPVFVSLAAGLLGPPAREAGLACSTCHREHRGRHEPVVELDSAQCQVCHARRFASLASGHPEFHAYPYARRTRIVFDHTSHLGQHFPDEGAEFRCTGCHELHAGREMVVSGFEAACASCHARQLTGHDRAGAKGVAFLRLPGVDVRTLREQGYATGCWPEWAEGPPTLFMRVLLGTGPGWPELERALADPDIDLENLEGQEGNCTEDLHH